MNEEEGCKDCQNNKLNFMDCEDVHYDELNDRYLCGNFVKKKE